MNLFKIDESQHPIFIGIAIVLAIVLLFNKNAKDIIVSDFKQPKFLIYLSGIIIFSVIVFKNESKSDKEKQFKDSVHKALIALTAAYFSHLHLFFAPFFIVFSGSYFLNML